MCAPAIRSLLPHQIADLHDHFSLLLPRIELHGCIYFRHLPPHRKEEVLQEMQALAWAWFRRLARRGKNPNEFVVTFCRLLVRAINSGRRVIGQEKGKDVMSRLAQKRHGFTVEPLPTSNSASHAKLYSAAHGQQDHDAMEERLQDNTLTPVPDQAAFRIDFPAWVQTRSDRDQRIIDELMAGERTFDVSRRHGLSPGRVSQLRREFHDDWLSFNSEKIDSQSAFAA